ncbi:hypothetical protein F5Y10DRAFT_188152 [Nemania abortiva]|nr:hypothetical protein F5Y10DRAFT_188152 [Nemania abortiva]
MRFICFHGRGSNGRLFEKQTERIRQAIGSEHTYVFATGSVPDEPLGLPSSKNGCFRFVGTDLAQRKLLLPKILRALKTHGPFDGVIGFSEGGLIAASLLLYDEHYSLYNLKCGIFFSAATPYDLKLFMQLGTSRMLDPEVDGVAIKVPTAHIWSDNDEKHPDMGQKLARLCDPTVREEFVNHGNHDIPGARDEEGLDEAIRTIERTIERARNS